MVMLVQSYFCHLAGHRACYPPYLTSDLDTQWTITLFAEGFIQKTPASSGALTLAPGWSCSLWTLKGVRTSPGHRSMAGVLTSWGVTLVQRHQLWSKMMEPKSQPSSWNIVQCKCFRNKCSDVIYCSLLQRGLCYPRHRHSDHHRWMAHQDHCVQVQCPGMEGGPPESHHRQKWLCMHKLHISREKGENINVGLYVNCWVVVFDSKIQVMRLLLSRICWRCSLLPEAMELEMKVR